MASDQPFSKIVTDENLMETAQHGSRNYPFAFIMRIYLYLTLTAWNGTGTWN